MGPKGLDAALPFSARLMNRPVGTPEGLKVTDGCMIPPRRDACGTVGRSEIRQKLGRASLRWKLAGLLLLWWSPRSERAGKPHEKMLPLGGRQRGYLPPRELLRMRRDPRLGVLYEKAVSFFLRYHR